jgi:excisionase family DNA binding protein
VSLGKLLTIPAAAKRLGLSVDQVRRLIDGGRITVTAIGEQGGRRGIYEGDCDAWLEAARAPVEPRRRRAVKVGRPAQHPVARGIADLMPRERRF